LSGKQASAVTPEPYSPDERLCNGLRPLQRDRPTTPEYDLGTGQALFQTSNTRLPMYPVTVENKEVHVTVANRREP
jgi:hypothetical protein